MKTFLRSLMVIAAMLVSYQGAAAQGYPNKALRIIVPYSPGGVPDVVARLLALRLADSLGQPVIVENKPGAKGGVAAGVINSLPADGYTFLLTDSAMLTINPQLTVKQSFDPRKDFSAVSLIAQAPMYMVVSSKLQVLTIDDFVAYSKSKPGGVNYGSSGPGSIHHLAAESLRAGLGIQMNHIPYRGTSNSIPALIGGEVDMVFAAYSSVNGFLKSGQVRLLGVSTAKRSPLTPNLDPIANKIPGFDYAVTLGMLVRSGTPQIAVKRMTDEVAKIAKQADFSEQLRQLGISSIGGTPNELEKALDTETANVAAAIKSANLAPE